MDKMKIKLGLLILIVLGYGHCPSALPGAAFPGSASLPVNVTTQPDFDSTSDRAATLQDSTSPPARATDLPDSASPPNILFITVDDLNNYVGAMETYPDALTPNMDRLADSGVLFSNAYAQAPDRKSVV